MNGTLLHFRRANTKFYVTPHRATWEIHHGRVPHTATLATIALLNVRRRYSCLNVLRMHYSCLSVQHLNLRAKRALVKWRGLIMCLDVARLNWNSAFFARLKRNSVVHV